MPADPRRVKDLFVAALELPDPAARLAFLDRECADDPELRQRLAVLLHAHDHPDSALEKPLAEAEELGTKSISLNASTAELPGHDVFAGSVVAGKYTLVESIGHGGMGSVWRAKQTEPVKRFVAVKLIKAGMDSKSVLARFEAERQALALMDHPNIAKVLDGGIIGKDEGGRTKEERGADSSSSFIPHPSSFHGRPFFVMELVKGVPITEYCDARKLTPKQRLELFVPVCQAIQHAHQKGIIHRDIKPSNVLIALYDDKPVVKVIDFGVAKATGAALTEHTIDTGFGGIVGTPQYMSPEQATFNNLDIDTRSDVYALGVLLYELLTGSPPFTRKELENRGVLEMLRVVREEEPPRPSTKLSTADALPTLSANRGTEPKKLTGLLRNELDWIVMKALEKDRSRRYETANGFAADVMRYLGGEAVQAHPPSTVYRMKKFVRRNKGQVIAAGLVLFALLAGVAGTTWGYQNAENSRLAEREQRRTAENLAVSERQAKLDAENQKIHAQFEERNAKKQRERAEKAYARTANVLDTMVSEVTGDSLATQKAIAAEQKKFLTEVLTYYQEFAGEKADDEKSRWRTAQAAYRVGVIEYRLGRLEESAAAVHKGGDDFAALAAEFPVPAYRHGLATSHNTLGLLLDKLGKQFEAQEHYRKGLGILVKLTAEFPNVPAYRQELARNHNNLGTLLTGLGKQSEAVEQHRQALAIREKLAAEFPANPRYRQELAMIHGNLGNNLSAFGQQSDAAQQYRQALAIQEKLAAEFPAVPAYRQELAMSQINLGIVLNDLGKQPEAVQQHLLGLTIQEKLVTEFPAVPAYRQELARSHNNLAHPLFDLGKRREAVEQYQQGLAIQAKLAAEFPAVPAYRQELARSHDNLGDLLTTLGKRREAEEQIRKGLAIQMRLVAEFPAVPEYRNDLANSHNLLGVLLPELGKRPEAVEQHRKALAIRAKLAAEFPAVTKYRQESAWSHNNLGNQIAGLGNRSEAMEHYRLAIAIQEKLVAEFPAIPACRHDLAMNHYNLGNQLADQGKRPEAVEQYRKALAIRANLAAEFPAIPKYRQVLANSHNNLAAQLAQLGKRPEAVEQYHKALAIQEGLVEEFPAVPDYRQNLANDHSNLGLELAGQRKRPEAAEQYRKALAIQEKLAIEFPAVDTYRVDLGHSYCNFGLLVRGGGKPADSLEWFTKAIGLLAPIHEREPWDESAKKNLQTSHWGRAVAYDQIRQFTLSLPDWKKAIEFSPKEEQPKLLVSRVQSWLRAAHVVEAVAEVAELTKSQTWNAAQWYTFASAYAFASGKIADKKDEYAKRAVELLQQAVKAGFKNASSMKEDPNLNPLRDREDFKKLIAKLDKAAEKK
ncbi:MAG TPA: tetratricopeptide repeat protein [Fimbriiglobus sp.]|jgi:serine/threonine protein kinase